MLINCDDLYACFCIQYPECNTLWDSDSCCHKGLLFIFFNANLKYKNTSKFHEAYTLIFSEDAIYFKTDSIDSELQWDVYSELWHNDNFYYLIQGVRMYTLIPKRVFKDSDEQEAFEELVQSKLRLIKRI